VLEARGWEVVGQAASGVLCSGERENMKMYE
jgi:hypothetical protein